jgi:DNA adenine methylase
MDYLNQPKQGVVFADPPYFVKGDALYLCTMTMFEHFQLADRLRKQNRWLATYDDNGVVRAIYSWASVTPYEAQYVVRQDVGFRRNVQELLISPHAWN